MIVFVELWRVVQTDYHYALIYVCRRSSTDDEACSYETLLVLGRPEALTLNSDELAEYFQLTLTSTCLSAANELDVATQAGNLPTAVNYGTVNY